MRASHGTGNVHQVGIQPDTRTPKPCVIRGSQSCDEARKNLRMRQTYIVKTCSTTRAQMTGIVIFPIPASVTGLRVV